MGLMGFTFRCHQTWPENPLNMEVSRNITEIRVVDQDDGRHLHVKRCTETRNSGVSLDKTPFR